MLAAPSHAELAVDEASQADQREKAADGGELLRLFSGIKASIHAPLFAKSTRFVV